MKFLLTRRGFSWSVFALLVVMIAPAVAEAAPFLVSDPYTAPAVIPDYFKVVVDTAASVNSPVYQVPGTSNYILHHDAGAVSIGSHTAKVQACKAATAWGPEACSAQINFTFVRPAVQQAPLDVSGIGLAAQ